MSLSGLKRVVDIKCVMCSSVTPHSADSAVVFHALKGVEGGDYQRHAWQTATSLPTRLQYTLHYIVYPEEQ